MFQGCKLCNKEFNSKVNLRQHVLNAHHEVQNSMEKPDTTCAFCHGSFVDVISHKKHINNLECLLFIVCCSCGERFEDHNAYVDHVYQHHLPPQQAGHDEYGYELFDHDGNSSSAHLRNPQNCPVCNKQYNNVSMSISRKSPIYKQNSFFSITMYYVTWNRSIRTNCRKSTNV